MSLIYFPFWIKLNNWYIKEENVLKQPKKPAKKNNIKFLLIIFKPRKIPKNNEAKTFTIKIVLEKNIFCLPEI